MADEPNFTVPSRRQIIGALGLGGGALLSGRAFAKPPASLPFLTGAETRPTASGFPQKANMIVQRVRPPLLETPWSAFNEGVFTPNDKFYVRWRWGAFPTHVDLDKFRLKIHGKVKSPLSLSVKDLVRDYPRFEIAAVNQCSGNSRGMFVPRVPGAQWGNGAMGNALWTGVRVKDALKRAGVDPKAVELRVFGLDGTTMPNAPRFTKSLKIDHALDGEVRP